MLTSVLPINPNNLSRFNKPYIQITVDIDGVLDFIFVEYNSSDKKAFELFEKVLKASDAVLTYAVFDEQNKPNHLHV